MRCAYRDLGEQQAGTTVQLALQGSAANVLLLDPRNYRRYRAGQSFNYYGGLANRPSMSLEVPHDDHWYLVVDLGGHRGRTRVRIVGIEPPDRDAAPASSQRRSGQRSASRPAGRRGEMAVH
jgi:hypothetical protein